MSSLPPKHSLSSPTSGNPHQPILPTPSSSTSVSLRQINYRSIQVKKELELQLVEKQRLMQESSSGIGKNVLARQIAQLQERIKEIDNVTQHMDLQSTNSIERLRSLERDLTSHRSHPLSPGISSIRNKEKLLNQRSASSSSTSNGLSPLPSPSASTLIPSTHGHDSTSLLPLPPPPTGSTPTKRRSKIPAADRRNTDIEFATEIGQGLLLEVRKMQALLQEKEEKLRTLENQKADLERAAEAMAKQMRQREENEEKLKEETWNLELAKQELVISVTELQSNLNKATSEQFKLAKQTSDLRSEIEQLRDKEEKLSNIIENMKQRHEQDMISIRRQAAAFQREKQEQTKRIQALTSELAITKAQSRIAAKPSMEESLVMLGEQSSVSLLQNSINHTNTNNGRTSASSSPPTSPKISPSCNQAMEVETLKTSLAHAHRMISNLRSNLHKEKTEKFEFKKLLAESQETIEQLRNEKVEKAEEAPKRTRKVSAKRRSGKRNKHKFNKKINEASSVYSYSSMSESAEEEEEESEMIMLASELSKTKPVMVDAQVNTDPHVPTENPFVNQGLVFVPLKPQAVRQVITVPQLSSEDALQTTEMGSSFPETNSREIGTSPALTTDPELETYNILQVSVAPTSDIPKAVISEPTLPTQETIQKKNVHVETHTCCGIHTQTDDAPVETLLLPPSPVTEDAFTQTETTSSSIDMLVQTETPDAKFSEILVQTETLLLNDTFVQTEEPSVVVSSVQTEIPSLSESSVQTLTPTTTETYTQTAAPILEQITLNSLSNAPIFVRWEDCSQMPVDIRPEDPAVAASLLAAAIQSARLASIQAAVTHATQYDPATTIDQETQHEGALVFDQQTQYDSVLVDQETQYDLVTSMDSAVQSGVIPGVDVHVQMDSVQTSTAFTQHDAVETKDVLVQSEVTETQDMWVQSELVDMKDVLVQSESVDTKDAYVQMVLEKNDSGIQYEPVWEVKHAFTQSDVAQNIETKDVSTQYETAGFTDAIFLQPLLNMNHDGVKTLSKSFNDKEEQAVQNKEKALTPSVNNDAPASTKVYTQAETDALIAAAVATALSITDPEPNNSPNEPKRHTCDMSANNNHNSRTHSIATTPYTGSLYMIDDYDASHYTEEDFGDVMVHLPTDKDIITYSPYREEREKKKQPRELELSIGPSIVHELKPTEDEMSPMTVVGTEEHKKELDLPPARPTTKPPTELLTKAMTAEMEKTPSLGSSSNNDNAVLLSMITQTMIGDWMWKYTRNAVGSEKRHQRFFWIHPYTRTLYWSTQAPGIEGRGETKAKSALIESVTTVPDYSATQYGLPNVSLLIQTGQRQLKITASTIEKHDAWFESLSYLVNHEDATTNSGITLLNDTPRNLVLNKSRSLSSMGPQFRRTNEISSIMDDDYDHEPLEDVRMCCNGKHHVSRLEKDHTHRHYRKRKSRATIATVA